MPYPQRIPSTGGESYDQSSDSKETAAAAVSTIKQSYVEPNRRKSLLHDLEDPTFKAESSSPPPYQEWKGIEARAGFPCRNYTVECSDSELKRWILSPNYPHDFSPKDKLNKPYHRGQKQNKNVSEQCATIFRGKCTGLYRELAMKIRGNIYFQVVLQTHYQAFSTIGVRLGVKYLNECIGPFELVFWVIIVMGLAGILSFLFRMTSIAITRFNMECERIFDILAHIFLALFISMAIAEMIILAATKRHFPCWTFTYYMDYLNFGIFLLLAIALLVYLDVILDALVPLISKSLQTPMSS